MPVPKVSVLERVDCTHLCVEIMDSRRQAKGELGHVVQIDVNVMLSLPIVFFSFSREWRDH